MLPRFVEMVVWIVPPAVMPNPLVSLACGVNVWGRRMSRMVLNGRLFVISSAASVRWRWSFRRRRRPRWRWSVSRNVATANFGWRWSAATLRTAAALAATPISLREHRDRKNEYQTCKPDDFLHLSLRMCHMSFRFLDSAGRPSKHRSEVSRSIHQSCRLKPLSANPPATSKAGFHMS